MILLALFPLVMIGTVLAIALTAESFHQDSYEDSDFYACCGKQKYASAMATELELVA